MKDIIRKLADIANHFDENGFLEYSKQIDYILEDMNKIAKKDLMKTYNKRHDDLARKETQKHKKNENEKDKEGDHPRVRETNKKSKTTK